MFVGAVQSELAGRLCQKRNDIGINLVEIVDGVDFGVAVVLQVVDCVVKYGDGGAMFVVCRVVDDLLRAADQHWSGDLFNWLVELVILA